MRRIVAIVVISLSGTAWAQDAPAKPAGVVAAIDRGLAFLAKDAVVWKQDHNCVSCHHAGLVIWSTREAKQRGYVVDEPILAEMTKWVAESGDGKFGLARPASAPKAFNPKAVWLALGLGADAKPDAAAQKGLNLLLTTVKSDQIENGSWSTWPDTRPPLQGPSDESMTALAAQGTAFLIKTQQGDGSWPMTSRPIKLGGAGSKNLIPITGGGSAWAVLGLVRSR